MGETISFIADSNFGMYKSDIETAKILASTKKKYGWPEYINVATGKNQKHRVLETSKILDGALRLSGSVQSLDPNVLENIKRKNISAEDLFDLGLQASNIGANTYSEIILGLPGETLNSHLDTIRKVINAGFTNIFLFTLMLLPGTEMATTESKLQYKMKSRYRVLPRCYGNYKILKKNIISAEIEEVCVANNTLSFKDYLFSRRFHLVITIFYNDSIFEGLLKLLRSLKLPVYDWMELMVHEKKDKRLNNLFESFLKATQDELWKDKKNLENYIKTPGIVEKFINGDLGNNLLFVYKTMAIVEHLKELCALAKKSLEKYLSMNNYLNKQISEFIDDVLLYHSYRATNLFNDISKTPKLHLNYNIEEFIKADSEADFSEFRLNKNKKNIFKFILDSTQRELLDRYLGIYGDSTVGIGRILSKVHVKKIFRHAVLTSDIHKVKERKESEHEYHLHGLQE